MSTLPDSSPSTRLLIDEDEKSNVDQLRIVHLVLQYYITDKKVMYFFWDIMKEHHKKEHKD